MIKGIKKFVIFTLFALCYSMQYQRGEQRFERIGKGLSLTASRIGVSTAEAKCCPAGSIGVRDDGTCY